MLFLATLPLLLLGPEAAAGADDAGKPSAYPARSLILRGAAPSTKPAEVRAPVPGAPSPEHSFGLELQQAFSTNNVSLFIRAFDFDALQRRFVPTLPAAADVQARLYAAPRANETWRRTLAKNATSEISALHLCFLGVRLYGMDPELLFRSLESQDLADNPVYVGYVTQRALDGSVHIIDVHRFAVGEMLSQILRRETLFELARKRLLSAPLNAHDQALLSSLKSMDLFETRCAYGHYHLTREAYDQLPPELQDDRLVLFQLANHGDQSINDLLIPIQRWRQFYPHDPCPDLLVWNFYWRLYYGPRWVDSGPGRGTYFGRSMSPTSEAGALDALERANLWFADPAMEIRLAGYFAEKQPAKARTLLQRALKRFPLEPSAFADLLKLDLAASNFDGVAETLRMQEQAMQTNLTAFVAASKDYTQFRGSFAWKKWQHDQHGVDAKTLVAGSGSH